MKASSGSGEWPRRRVCMGGKIRDEGGGRKAGRGGELSNVPARGGMVLGDQEAGAGGCGGRGGAAGAWGGGGGEAEGEREELAGEVARRVGRGAGDEGKRAGGGVEAVEFDRPWVAVDDQQFADADVGVEGDLLAGAVVGG